MDAIPTQDVVGRDILGVLVRREDGVRANRWDTNPGRPWRRRGEKSSDCPRCHGYGMPQFAALNGGRCALCNARPRMAE